MDGAYDLTSAATSMITDNNVDFNNCGPFAVELESSSQMHSGNQESNPLTSTMADTLETEHDAERQQVDTKFADQNFSNQLDHDINLLDNIPVDGAYDAITNGGTGGVYSSK